MNHVHCFFLGSLIKISAPKHITTRLDGCTTDCQVSQSKLISPRCRQIKTLSWRGSNEKRYSGCTFTTGNCVTYSQTAYSVFLWAFDVFCGNELMLISLTCEHELRIRLKRLLWVSIHQQMVTHLGLGLVTVSRCARSISNASVELLK